MKIGGTSKQKGTWDLEVNALLSHRGISLRLHGKFVTSLPPDHKNRASRTFPPIPVQCLCQALVLDSLLDASLCAPCRPLTLARLASTSISIIVCAETPAETRFGDATCAQPSTCKDARKMKPHEEEAIQPRCRTQRALGRALLHFLKQPFFAGCMYCPMKARSAPWHVLHERWGGSRNDGKKRRDLTCSTRHPSSMRCSRFHRWQTQGINRFRLSCAARPSPQRRKVKQLLERGRVDRRLSGTG